MEMFECSSCGSPIKETDTFCGYCGAQFADSKTNEIEEVEEVEETVDTFYCSNCGCEISIDSNECPQCGAVFEDGGSSELVNNSVDDEDEDLVFKVDGGLDKSLYVYEDRAVIRITSTAKAFFLDGITGATRGDKTFFYSDISSVQFKNLRATTGYLQFEYPGSHSGNNFTSENSFRFSEPIGSKKYEELRELMPKVYEYILNKVKASKENNNKGGTVVQQLSSADEIRKFKELLDDGIITKKEFDEKKKQLLGL